MRDESDGSEKGRCDASCSYSIIIDAQCFNLIFLGVLMKIGYSISAVSLKNVHYFRLQCAFWISRSCMCSVVHVGGMFLRLYDEV